MSNTLPPPVCVFPSPMLRAYEPGATWVASNGETEHLGKYRDDLYVLVSTDGGRPTGDWVMQHLPAGPAWGVECQTEGDVLITYFRLI